MVERGPEKAGVGGSIPSLATIFSKSYVPFSQRFRSRTRGGVGLLSVQNPGKCRCSTKSAPSICLRQLQRFRFCCLQNAGCQVAFSLRKSHLARCQRCQQVNRKRSSALLWTAFLPDASAEDFSFTHEYGFSSRRTSGHAQFSVTDSFTAETVRSPSAQGSSECLVHDIWT